MALWNLRVVMVGLSAAAMLAALLVSAQGTSHRIDWEAIPTSPPGARVIDSSVGKCICDDHAQGCDPNCCCDTSCTANAKQHAFITCDPEVFSDRTWVRCYDANSATSIVRTQRESTPTVDQTTAGAKAVCIVRDRYDKGMNPEFDPIGPLGSITTPIPQEWYAPREHSAVFKAGDVLPTLFATHTGAKWRLTTRGPGFLTQRRPGTNGICTDDKTVKFLEPPINTARCVLQGTISQVCAAASTEAFAFMAMAPPADTLLNTATLVPVTVKVIDATTRAVLRTTTPTQTFVNLVQPTPNPPTTPTTTNDRMLDTDAEAQQNDAAAGAGARRAASESTTVLEPPSGTTTPPTPWRCRGAVVATHFSIVYDFSAGPARIVSATVELFVDDVTAPSATDLVSLPHESVVTFREMTATTVPSERRGSPGYMAGGRIEAGHVLEQGLPAKTAVQRRVLGFSVPFGRLCATATMRPVSFLHDVVNSACGFEMTEEQLIQDVCGSQATNDRLKALFTREVTNPTSAAGVASGATTKFEPVTHVGRTADAREWVPSDWLEISGYPWPVPSASLYNNIQRRCDNVIVGLHYTFVVGRAGVEYNPQDIIVGAKVVPIIGSYAFRNGASIAGKSMFYFQFRVSFVRHDASSKATRLRRVVPPPILPELDSNVFYPFRYPGGETGTENKEK